MKIGQNKYKAFTLIEMLIVMTIFIILLAIGIEAFSGLRATILMNQSVENFKQNTKWTQRAAVLLKRDPGENWLYGVGFDLTDFFTPPCPDCEPEYKIFKWCSDKDEFLDDVYAQDKFPNFIYGTNLGVGNNARLIPTEVPCNGNAKGIKYIAASESEGGLKGIGAVNDFKIPEPLIVGYRTSSPLGNPRFVVYESVTGTVFYYDNNGNLKNYDLTDPYDRFSSPQLVLDFVIAPLDKSRGINIKINPVSGRVETDSLNENEVTNNYTFP